MLRHALVCALAGLGLTAAGCCTKPPAPEPQRQSQSQAGRYQLGHGSSIGISTGTDGKSTIVVAIPSGSPRPGAHASTADALVEPARSAKNQLNEPGVSVVIDVDAAGRLVAIEQTQTK